MIEEGDRLEVTYTTSTGKTDTFRGTVRKSSVIRHHISNSDETFLLKEDGTVLQGVGGMSFKIGEDAEITVLED